MTSQFIFATYGVGGAYHVLLREDKTIIGHVRKYEKRFNLRRLFVVRGWTATLKGEFRPISRSPGPEAEATVHRTREEAAQALFTRWTQIEGDPRD